MLYIFDLDGTIRVTRSGRPCPNCMSDQVLLPGVKKKLIELEEAGHKLAIATNQGGVSYGYMTVLGVWQNVLQVNVLCDYVFSDCRVSYYSPSAPRSINFANDAKPRPDMLLSIVNCQELGAIYVGNAKTDKQAAKAAGVGFAWAHKFFGTRDKFAWEVVENEHGYHPKDWFALNQEFMRDIDKGGEGSKKEE